MNPQTKSQRDYISLSQNIKKDSQLDGNAIH